MERELEELRAQMGGGDSGKDYGDCCGDICYSCRGGLSVFVEGTVFQYNRADGHRVGIASGAPDEAYNADWFISPRISMAYQNCIRPGDSRTLVALRSRHAEPS